MTGCRCELTVTDAAINDPPCPKCGERFRTVTLHQRPGAGADRAGSKLLDLETRFSDESPGYVAGNPVAYKVYRHFVD